MSYNEAEYSSLRAEIIHHDGNCVNILSYLIGASTAVYALVAEGNTFPLLLLLSIVWFVGFLYIAERRATIRRIAKYIRDRLEQENESLHWETYSHQDRNKSRRKKELNKYPMLPVISPLKIEFSLLFIVTLANTTWLFVVEHFSLGIVSVLLSAGFVFYALNIVRQYYFEPPDTTD